MPYYAETGRSRPLYELRDFTNKKLVLNISLAACLSIYIPPPPPHPPKEKKDLWGWGRCVLSNRKLSKAPPIILTLKFQTPFICQLCYGPIV